MQTCRLTINIVVHNRLDMTRACVTSLLANTTEPFLLQITDNASTDGTWTYLKELAASHENVTVVRKSRNEGFPGRQNEMARQVRTPYLCVLNNDVEVGPGWQEPLLYALEEDSGLAQVGPSGPSIPTHLGGEWTGRAEYIEGWCFVMPRRLLGTFDLFSPLYYFAYFEDTDLSLRLQEAGYRIRAVPAPVFHKHSATRKVCKLDVMGYEIRNRLAFEGRWHAYLQRRSFEYRCKLIRPAAHGDVLMLTPALRALRGKWPHAFIAVETDCAEVLLHNPYVNQVIRAGQDDRSDWDYVWDLTDASERLPHLPPMLAYCEVLDVKPDRLRPDFFIHDWDRQVVSDLVPGVPFAVFHVGKSWQTKMWAFDRFKTLGLILQERMGLRIVEVGNGDTHRLWLDLDLRGRLSWQGLGAVMERAAVFVGIDSGPAHVAQAMGTPSVVLFGPTRPEFLLHDGARARAVNTDWLACSGCYHAHPPGTRYANCYRGDLKCMNDITVEQVARAVKEVMGNA